MITFEFSDGTTETVEWVTTRPGRVSFDTPVFQGAGSAAWHAAGRGAPGDTPIELDVHVRDSTISDAAGQVNALIFTARAAVAIGTPFGAWRVAGVRSVAEVPAGVGYRVTIRMLAIGERHSELADVLRFVDGTVWEM